jgi:hypothetical protein
MTSTVHRSAPTPGNKSWPPYATPLSVPYASPAPPTSPLPTAITPVTAPARFADHGDDEDRHLRRLAGAVALEAMKSERPEVGFGRRV